MPARRLTILTGAIDSGKTSWCLAFARSHPGADGVLLKKVFRGGRRVGYDALRLATGRRAAFARLAGAEPAGFQTVERVGAFNIGRAGRRAANRWLLEALQSGAKVLIVDEIGPLELAGGGLADSIPAVLASSSVRHLILVVRRGCLEQAIERFRLPEHRRLELPGAVHRLI